MIAFLIPFLHVLVSPFRTQARLEAEIVLLRHQLNVLRRRVPSKLGDSRSPALRVALSLVSVGAECRNHFAARHDYPVASDGLPTVLALEVAVTWRSAQNSSRDPAPYPRDEPGQHLSLDKDSPGRRPIQWYGQLAAQPILGGLHHEYCRMVLGGDKAI